MLAVRADHGVGFKHRGLALFEVTICMTLVALATVIIRIQQRLKAGRKLGHDDFVISASMGFCIILGVITCVGVEFGYGMSQTMLDGYDEYVARLTFLLEQVFYKATITCTKVSILLLYLRIFPSKKFRMAAWFMLILVAGYGTSTIFATIFQCVPVAKLFDHTVKGHCINLTAFWYTNASVNFLSDLIILALPGKFIWNLHLRLQYKMGLVLVFGLGIFVTAITIVRSVTLGAGSKSADITFGSLTSTIWTIIEANTGIICACLPMWKTLLGTFMPCLFPNDTTNDNSGPRAPRRPVTQPNANSFRGWGGFGNGRKRAFPLSRGRFGASRTSQASSQAPMIPLTPIRKDTMVAVRYESTVEAGGPIVEEEEELDFSIPQTRLHDQEFAH